MKVFAPEYYKKFRCIAEKCRHSCCIGWEIDIDEDTLEYYRTIEGNLGERLKNNIVYENDTAHFALDKTERCPFLNSNGLCDIISQLGEQALCQICNDHPRFRNFYSDRTEIGVGMCCEAAAELILLHDEKFALVCLESDGEEFLYPEEEELINVRQQMFEILTDRTVTTEKRVQKLLDFCEISLPHKSLQNGRIFICRWKDLTIYGRVCSQNLNIQNQTAACRIMRIPKQHLNSFCVILYTAISQTVLTMTGCGNV